MISDMSRFFTGVVLGAAVCAGATGAMAQAARSKVDAAVTPGVPEFRDPTTGQIWTPDNVGQSGGSDKPEDQAFNPDAQTATVSGIVRQQTPVTPLGVVPITAGPTVPIVSLAISSFSVVPARRWQAILYLANNSASVVQPVIDCSFTNGSQVVQTTRAALPAVGAGVRVGFTVYGPPASKFADHASCNVVSP